METLSPRGPAGARPAPHETRPAAGHALRRRRVVAVASRLAITTEDADLALHALLLGDVDKGRGRDAVDHEATLLLKIYAHLAALARKQIGALLAERDPLGPGACNLASGILARAAAAMAIVVKALRSLGAGPGAVEESEEAK